VGVTLLLRGQIFGALYPTQSGLRQKHIVERIAAV
jgi:hypothetical protein